ncbi:hypothetical protein M5K25_010038 [Dendrobium thyrsiflorum]|uniref:Uncharacterized protein n=1 Tax=Dendrobium thyrsiflorum TaxID=117978 RepID=A0ABD0UZT7_DENTH
MGPNQRPEAHFEDPSFIIERGSKRGRRGVKARKQGGEGRKGRRQTKVFLPPNSSSTTAGLPPSLRLSQDFRLATNLCWTSF